MLSRVSRMRLYALIGLLVIGVHGAAQGGLLADQVALNTVTTLPAPFSGAQTFAASGGPPIPGFMIVMSANVDFAVFAPGNFDAAFPGLDPSGGTEYVYAYQIKNTGDTQATSLTVGLHGDEPLGSVGFIPDNTLSLPSIAPFNSQFTTGSSTSVAWDFNQGDLTNGLSSAVLFFTSAAAPELDTATVMAQLPNTQLLPSPLPEPATIGLVLAGVCVMIVGKRRRT